MSITTWYRHSIIVLFLSLKSFFKFASFVLYLVTNLMDLMQYHGGTNFDRLASAFITTAYYDEAPLDEYGMIFSFLHLSKITNIKTVIM